MTKEELDQSIRELSTTVKHLENGYPNSKQLTRAAEILMRDLTEEGFEVPEIREFFTQLIANDI
jgi:hypothetical protein